MSAYLDERYFDWLYDQVCSVRWKSPARSYRNLFHILYTHEFIWLIPNDDNRVADGKDLRLRFLEDEGITADRRDSHWMALGCSYLELLVAISDRLAFETGRDQSSWFWELLENLGLHQLNDRVDISLDDVEDTLNRVMWRTYDYNGEGGLFPLEFPEEDQRKVELWYQLNAYILERS